MRGFLIGAFALIFIATVIMIALDATHTIKEKYYYCPPGMVMLDGRAQGWPNHQYVCINGQAAKEVWQ